VVGKPQAVIAVLQAKEDILKTMAPDRVKAYSKHDVFAWFTPAGVSKEIRQEIHNTMKGILMMGNLAGEPEATTENAQQTVDKFDRFFDEIKELTLGINLDIKAGLSLNAYGRAKEGTEIAKKMAVAKTSDKSLLAGLPDEPFVLAVGLTNTPTDPNQKKQSSMILDAFEKIARQSGINITPQKNGYYQGNIPEAFCIL